MYKIQLDKDLHDKIFLAKEGVGGFQRLFKKLDKKINTDCVLIIDDETYARIDRYAYSYGNGGNQQILRQIVEKR